MLRHTKGVRNTKKQAFRQHVVKNQKTFATIVSQNTLPQPKTNKTNTFTAEQLTNVVIQIAQAQICYPNPKQDTPDLKSSICWKIPNGAKTILSVSITGKDLSESVGSLSAPAPHKPFTFTSTKVNPVSKTIPKPSAVLKSITPPNKSAKAAYNLEVGSTHHRTS